MDQLQEVVKKNKEMYRIIVEWERGKKEIKINKNLIINNLIANLQDEEQMGKVLSHNNKRL